MSDLKRWIEEDGGAPAGARKLLRSAVRPGPMTPAEAARTAARVAPLGAKASGGAALPTWSKGLLLVAGLGARALLARSPEASLAALDEHRREFPRGQLMAEREFIAIDALVRLGRTEEARARAEAFLKRHASSPYAARVRRLGGSAPPGSAP